MAGEGTRKKSQEGRESLSQGRSGGCGSCSFVWSSSALSSWAGGWTWGRCPSSPPRWGNWSGRTRIFRRFSRGWGSPSPRENQRWKPSVPSGQDVFPGGNTGPDAGEGAAPEQPAAQEEQAEGGADGAENNS